MAQTGVHDTKRGVEHPLFLGSILFLAVAFSLLILKFAPAPFFWVWITWAATLFAVIFCIRGDWLRAILLSVGIVACLLATAEAYLVTNEYKPPIYPDGDFFVHDDVLGWAPVKGIAAHAIKPNPVGLFQGPRGLLFDRTYTIDANGLRIAPPYDKDNLVNTILFFGCSFTFGEGLEDNETLPYQVGIQSGGRDRTFNFAFQAYGPQHMLAVIEHGMVSRVVDTTPRYAFYTAIPGHVWRVAGRVTWGGHAPRYVLDADGTVRQEGYLADRKSLDQLLGLGYDSHIKGQLDKWAIWRMFPVREPRITDDDIRLYFAVVRRSQQLLADQYPGIEFHVILWPDSNGGEEKYVYEKLRDGFRQMGFQLHLADEILPGYKTDRSRYILGPLDRHPNALANRLLAHYILSQITAPAR